MSSIGVLHTHATNFENTFSQMSLPSEALIKKYFTKYCKFKVGFRMCGVRYHILSRDRSYRRSRNIFGERAKTGPAPIDCSKCNKFKTECSGRIENMGYATMHRCCSLRTRSSATEIDMFGKCSGWRTSHFCSTKLEVKKTFRARERFTSSCEAGIWATNVPSIVV